MHKGFIQKLPFVRWHTAIFSSLAIEYDVRGDDRAANDGGAIKELLTRAAGVGARDLAAGLHIVAAEGLLEGISRFSERRDGRRGL